ncbi:MAG: lipopolysaccharide biosynthesis protein [Prevotella sp.]|nr:lipopolysaccharide biosynthesis protein [Prevotella sp.]
MAESLKEKTAKGLFWGGMNNSVQQLLGLLFGIILGRILSPTDYGMIAMISVFSLIATELQTGGFKTALTNLDDPSPNDYNAVFWFNILMGSGLYVILFFCAPLIAAYYHTPELIPLCRYAFLGFVFSSFGAAQSAYLFKNLRAKQQAKAGMTAVLLSSTIGVTMAWKGYSYWALATQTNIYVLTCTLLYWHYSPWRPSWHVDFTPIKRMFRFSSKILVSGILTCINNSVLNILLGRYYSAQATGYYNQAYQWNTKCYYMLQGMLTQVSQPVMVSIRDDHERRLRVLRKLMRFTAFISFPLLFGFGLVAKELIVITISEKWLDSVQLLQLLCISGAFMPLNTVMSNTVISCGRSGIYLWCTAVLGALQVLLMISIYPLGIQTMVAANVALNILWVFVWHYFTQRLTGYRLTMLLKDIIPFAFVAVAVLAATYEITRWINAPFALMMAKIIIAALLYYTVMKIARVRILDDCIDFLLRRHTHY